MDNYTGPYWSNGKLQTSVLFGDKKPTSALDVQSRLHDSAYAKFQDTQHRRAADLIYNNNVKKLGLAGALAGASVLYGNQVLRSCSNLIPSYNLLGMVKGGIQNMRDLHDWMINKDRYIREVQMFLGTDPYKNTHWVVTNPGSSSTATTSATASSQPTAHVPVSNVAPVLNDDSEFLDAAQPIGTMYYMGEPAPAVSTAQSGSHIVDLQNSGGSLMTNFNVLRQHTSLMPRRRRPRYLKSTHKYGKQN